MQRHFEDLALNQRRAEVGDLAGGGIPADVVARERTLGKSQNRGRPLSGKGTCSAWATAFLGVLSVGECGGVR